MATPTNLPATFVAGNILTAQQQNDLRGAFRVLQVVSATTSTSVSASIVAYVDTNLTVTITPQSATSKIFVMVNQSLFVDTAANESNYRLLRNGTAMQTQKSPAFSSAGTVVGQGVFMYLDSPATTSPVTYKTQIAIALGAGLIYANVNNNPANITVSEISA
jgi:hypothetical protein